MRPRLESQPFTAEDAGIWSARWLRSDQVWFRLRKHSMQSDRRDAELMSAWADGWPVDLGFCDESGPVLWGLLGRVE